MTPTHKKLLEDMFGIRDDNTMELTEVVHEVMDRAEARVFRRYERDQEMPYEVLVALMKDLSDDQCVDKVIPFPRMPDLSDLQKGALLNRAKKDGITVPDDCTSDRDIASFMMDCYRSRAEEKIAKLKADRAKAKLEKG